MYSALAVSKGLDSVKKSSGYSEDGAGGDGIDQYADLEDELGSDSFEAQMYDDAPPRISERTVARLTTSVNENGTLREILKAKKSDFVQNLIYLDGKPFDFTGRGYLRPIYDGGFKRILLKTARQVEKTTFLANNLTITSVVMPYNKSLYVSPSHTQTRQFSNEKLRPSIERSPLIKRYFQDSSVSTQVFEKGFTNGAYIFLRSAFRSADRTRGISARVLCLDEIQDFLTTEIPVIMECTSHFEDASNLMAGTPKSHDNPIEVYWNSTTQAEWMVPCTGCGKRNFLDENNIGPTDWYVSKRLPPGPICKKCQKPIDPSTGRWFEFSPDNMIKGFRIPQLMVPWITGIYEQWLKLLWKRDNYPFGQFNNEVLGLSYDSASKPITRDEIMEACKDYSLWNLSTVEGTRAAVAEAKKYQLTAGVDWGEGNDGSEKSPSGKIRNASYTVVSIGAYTSQKKWKLFYAKRYEGREIDPDFVVKDITRICQVLGVRLIGADWGHGWGVNNILVRTFGVQRVAQFQYMPKLKQRMKWDALGFRYHLQRNFILSELFFDIKHGLVDFPRYKEFETFAKDILGIYAEYNEYRREIKYDHRPSDPDDFFHSLNYAKLMSDIMTGKSRRYTADAVEVEGPHN